MWPDLHRRREDLHERMDDPGCDLRTLQRTYQQFGPVNALVASWAPVYRRWLRPALDPGRPTTLLDIGCGGGDIARKLATWAARDGLTLRVTGIDNDARAVSYARSRTPQFGVTFRQALSSDLVREGQRYDLVVSNHLLHHLNPQERTSVLHDSEQLCRQLAVHSDIERSMLAYAAYGLLVAPLFGSSFVREDGLLSIRRSYTTQELRAVAPPAWQVRGQFPCRNLLIYQAGHRA